MGAYLTKPSKEAKSDDIVEGDKYECGVSGMQGWRVSMEDAYNCIYDMDPNTGFFAVYDGHGGAEVAIYCSHHFTEILKERSEYKEGRIEDALKATFMEIDERLKQPSVIKELKLLSQMEPGASPVTEEDINKAEEERKRDEEDCEDEAKLLCEEATMSIEDLLAKYGQVVYKTREAMMSFNNAEEASTESTEGAETASEEQSTTPKCDIEAGADVTLVSTEKTEQIFAETSSVKTKKEEDEEITEKDSVPDNDFCIKKLKKTFIKRKRPKPEDDDDSDDDDYDGSGSDEAVDGSSSDEEENSSDEGASSTEEVESSDAGEEKENADEDVGLKMGTSFEEPGVDSGTTAVVAVLRGIDLYVANAGDSRCVLCREDGVAFDMSDDHKPEDERELARIEAAGGEVNYQGRVNGGLNLSRAIGDHCYKKNQDLPLHEQMISAMPDVRKVRLQPEDEFMVIACDGIWNVLSSQEAIDFVRERLYPKDNVEAEKSVKLSQICEELFEKCIAPDTMGDGSGCDNMTCIIVKFQQDWLKKKHSVIAALNDFQTEEKNIGESPAEIREANSLVEVSCNHHGDSTAQDIAKKSSINLETIPMEGPLKETSKRPLVESEDDSNCMNGLQTKRIKTN